MSVDQTTTYDRVASEIDRVKRAALEKQMTPEHRDLIALIESDRHLLIGAKALAQHMEQRFTEDTDYLVGRRTFERVRKWFQQRGVEHKDLGEAIQAPGIAIDVIDANYHPVLKEILKHETGLPSPEALAAMKYIAIVSRMRSQRKMYSDISDLVGLVKLPGFELQKMLNYLVDRFEEQRSQVQELVGKIQRGERDITI